MIKIKARGWPWQRAPQFWANDADGTVGEKWGWNPFKVKGMGRFGGGWGIKLGVAISSSGRDWVFDLVIGSISVTWEKKK